MAEQLDQRRRQPPPSSQTSPSPQTAPSTRSAAATHAASSTETDSAETDSTRAADRADRPTSDQFYQELGAADLAEVLREASRMQERGELATLGEAIETARELGIDAKHVVAAAEKLQREKTRVARLRTITARRRAEFLRFAGLMLVVSLFLFFIAGPYPARMTFFGMSIAAFIMGMKWAGALAAERKPELLGDESEPGDCRVCGRAAETPHGHYCRDHKPARK